MNSLFDTNIAGEIIARIRNLSSQSIAQWGSMTVEQMLAHCADVFRDILLDRETPVLVTPEIAERVKQVVLAPEPFAQNLRAIGHYRSEVGGTRPTDFIQDRATLISYIERFSATAEGHRFGPHPAIGQLTREEHGYYTWKHLDHHLRQFGV